MSVVDLTSPAYEKCVEFNYNDSGIASGISWFTIPISAKITSTRVYVETVFNDSGTDLLNVGFSAGGTELFQTADVNMAATGLTEQYRYFALNPLSAARTIHYRYVGQNGNATTGKGHIVIRWVET